MNVGGLFDGVGLLAYGLHLAGLTHSWLCEVDPWRREILGKRWPGVPVFDDVRAVGTATAQRVDVIAGGFPCKGASSAGKRNGFDHPETVLWREMARVVDELRPRYVIVENVADLLRVRGGDVWGEVLGTLATLGFGVVWDCLPAGAFGAPHRRDRVIAIATHPDRAPTNPHAAAGASRTSAGQRASAAPVAASERRPAFESEVQQPRLEPVSGGSDDAAADAGVRRLAEQSPEHCREAARPYANPVGRGVPVEWGTYGPAIRRWERIVGAAPEPLVRRMDDGSALRVERSRLSALGDGVQVQLGHMVGSYLMSLEADRAVA